MTRGLIGIGLGLVAIVWPGITIAVLVSLFGVFAILDGVSILAYGVAGERSWTSALHGAIGIFLGVVALAWPGATAIVLVMLIAAWSIAMGLLEIVDAVRFRQAILGESLQGLSGVMSLLFGGLVFAFPGAGAFVLAMLFGMYAIVSGVVLVTLGLRLRSEIGA